MSLGRAALLRPIEITSATDTFTVNTLAKTIPNGTYASALTLCSAITTLGQVTLGANFACGMTSTGRVFFSNSAGFSIGFTDTLLRDYLGFTADLAGTDYYVGTYPIRHAWISDYASNDREFWKVDQRQTFAGQVARSGRLCGLSTGPSIYHRRLEFACETAENVFRSAHVAGANGWYRCLESFVEEARSSTPLVATHAPTNGCYYWYDLSLLSGISMSAMTSGAYNFLNTDGAGATAYHWCHLDQIGADNISPSLGVNRNWYSVSISLHTATAPTWDVPT